MSLRSRIAIAIIVVGVLATARFVYDVYQAAVLRDSMELVEKIHPK